MSYVGLSVCPSVTLSTVAKR